MMTKSFGTMHALMALAGMTVLGCGDSARTGTSMPTTPGDDLSEPAAVVKEADAETALQALDDRKGGRKDDDDDAATQADAGVVDDGGVDDDDDRDRGDRGDRGGNRGPGNGGGNRGPGGGGDGFARGLEQLLAVADLDALQKCQDIAQGCAGGNDAGGCRAEVEACVRPVLTAAFGTLCEQRAAECKQSGASDDACKRAEQFCNDVAKPAKP
jgi:hypothetical protein